MPNKHKCQNNETQVVIDYFANKYGSNFKGTVLDIGANDGVTFSNSFDLIEAGWYGYLVEPSSAFNEIAAFYCAYPNVEYFNVAVGPTRGNMVLYESGAHVPGGVDKALVSTLVPAEMNRWGSVEFNPVNVEVVKFDDLFNLMNRPEEIHYLTIDVEGFEMQILKQIDLYDIGCDVLCIEYNGRSDLRVAFSQYCGRYGLKQIHINGENLIYAR